MSFSFSPYDAVMSWLDILPSSERAKIRQRLRSPEAYERLRRNVKGPEDLKQDMEKNESVAELKFALEMEPVMHEALRQKVDADIKEKGIRKVLDMKGVSPESQAAVEDGNFDVRVHAVSKSSDALVVHPEGNVAEKIPIKPSYSEQYLSQFQSDD